LTALRGLLFGPERGMLFFVPWALALIPLLFVPLKKVPGGSRLFLCGGLLGLLWMNASVGSWDGGLSAGPRYLCLIFPAIAFLLAQSWASRKAIAGKIKQR